VPAVRRPRPTALSAIVGLAAIALAAAMASPTAVAAATTTSVEAEALPVSAPCWSVVSNPKLSGGAGRGCSTANALLSWTVTVPAGAKATLRLYGLRDATARKFRVRIDGGVWKSGTLSVSAKPSALFFTVQGLASGPHRVDLGWVSSPASFVFDYYQLATSTTTPSTTTTTGAGPTTTTTTAPPTSVCRIAPPSGEANIAAAIASCPDGSTVQFPSGAAYTQAGPIEVRDRSNLTIDGGGSSFSNSAPNTAVVKPNWNIFRGSNVTVRNMTVNGNFHLTGPRSLVTVRNIAVNQWNSGFFVLGGDGVTISDVTVNDVFGDFVTTVPSGWAPTDAGGGTMMPHNINIVRLSGTSAARQCVALSASTGFSLQDSTLRDCWWGGVDMEIDQKVSGIPMHDIHILRNTFDGYNMFAIAAAYPGATGDVDTVEVRGNTTLTPPDTCRPPIIFGFYPDNPNQERNIVVAGNNLKSLANGIAFDHVVNGTIQGNTIQKTAPDSLCGPPAPIALSITSSTGVTTSSNTVSGYS
jgi:hypothetical protein